MGKAAPRRLPRRRLRQHGRRPLLAAEEFPTIEAQNEERAKLHGIIEKLVVWENSADEKLLAEARWQIARSVARARNEAPPPEDDPAAVLGWLAARAPAVYDPFCGGGSIPLEAQRLGLRAVGTDLNPVAVLITKALIELPPKFRDQPPANPDADPMGTNRVLLCGPCICSRARPTR